MGTAGTGIWDPKGDNADQNAELNGDDGDKVPDGEGIDSLKEKTTYQNQYGTSMNDFIIEGHENQPK
jgi:hypothetical protein